MIVLTRWTIEQAQAWQKDTGWLVGMNYLPSSAVNSTEMWMNETFDKDTIRRELMRASDFGFNSCRVFLPFIVWDNQRDLFMENLDRFLDIAEDAGLKTAPVLFDDCAFSGSEPYLGRQHAPVKGIHNSGWTPSPGSSIADDPDKRPRLMRYVKDVVTTHQVDKRVIFWDIYNEPGNNNRCTKCLELLFLAFNWARECEPSQPLTAGIWMWESYDLVCAEISDVISFHDYSPLMVTEKRVEALMQYGRPMICTEWLHRQNRNIVASHLPYYHGKGIGLFNWGFVQGKTQTNLSWNNELNTNDGQPDLWQHDLIHTDGRVYDATEQALFIEYAKKEECLHEDNIVSASAGNDTSAYGRAGKVEPNHTIVPGA